ncbi:hypothetical protein MY11210_000823 [Beauveria gryllotalpidicola]
MTSQLPHVLSVSYGEDELSVPKQYAKRVCDAYGLLTKRGTTIVHAPGDGGSTGGHNGNCRSRDGKNTDTTMPTFPDSCPWVTTVGATHQGSNPQNDEAAIRSLDSRRRYHVGRNNEDE